MTIEELKIEADKLGYNLTKNQKVLSYCRALCAAAKLLASGLAVVSTLDAAETGKLSLTISFA